LRAPGGPSAAALASRFGFLALTISRGSVRAMRAALALILCFATSAHADPATEAPVQITIQLSDPAKPIQPGPRDSASFKPQVTAAQVLSVEGLVGHVRSEQEQILADLIASTPDTEVDEKGNYYFMLSELHAKQYQHWRTRSAELTSQAGPSKDAKTKAEATAAAEKAKQYLEKAVKVYKTFTDNPIYGNYPKMDMALFYYGHTLQSGKQMVEARQVYEKLIKHYPNSKFVPDVYVLFGDYYFDSGALADAELHYKAALKFPRSSAYWYAMYKIGWIYLHLQRYQEALEAFFQTAQATKLDRSQDLLKRAAVGDFVRAYAEIGKPDKALAAFQRVDGARAVEMLQLLGVYYLDQGKADLAIYTYQELLKAEPANQNRCLWQYNLARASAYNAARQVALEVCAADVEPLKAWARTRGAKVVCPSCGGKKRP
jgi:tetratricopeptide (TPR) repeat protein